MDSKTDLQNISLLHEFSINRFTFLSIQAQLCKSIFMFINAFDGYMKALTCDTLYINLTN